VIGCISVESEKPVAFDEHDERLLATMSDQAALAISNARLFGNAKRRLDQLQALHYIDLAISSSMDLHWIMDIFLEQATRFLEVDAADILIFDAHSQILDYLAGKGFRTTAFQHTHLRLGEGYAGKAALSRQTVTVENLKNRKTDFLRSHTFAQEGFEQYYGIPLIVKGYIKGVLELFCRSQVARREEWPNFLDTFAGQAAIAIDNTQLFRDLQRSNLELAMAYEATIEGWSRAMDLRDRETEGHTQRVTDLTLKLARAMNIADAEIVNIRRGALLHDVGKLGVPDNILFKPDKLTDEEWAIMHQHPNYAYEMLLPIAYLKHALDIPYCHHEKWDGTGYPRGLKGKEIPPSARIFAVADVWDALTSDRPYRKAWGKEKALGYITEQSEKHFDPQVVKAFLNIHRE
jgi:HD-GYP domain-containing protein (c-di-GMP phosphodiesterase class II)